MIAPARMNTYWSVRTNRTAQKAVGRQGSATLTQAIEAAPYRGRRIRLRAQVRADARGAGNQSQLWLRVDRPDGASGFFDNMSDRPVTSPQWKRHEILGTVADDAEVIAFGGIAQGFGEFGFDDFELAVADSNTWTVLDIGNPGFESDQPPLEPETARGALRPETYGRWIAMMPGYEYRMGSMSARGSARSSY